MQFHDGLFVLIRAYNYLPSAVNVLVPQMTRTLLLNLQLGEEMLR